MIYNCAKIVSKSNQIQNPTEQTTKKSIIDTTQLSANLKRSELNL